MSTLPRLYTQNNCPFCVIMKDKLDDWGIKYEVINLHEQPDAKTFLKENGHRTVPQLYYRNIHLNKDVDTVDFTSKLFFSQMKTAWDMSDSGVESFG